MPFDGITLYGVMHELKDCLTGNRINKIYQTSKMKLYSLFVIIEKITSFYFRQIPLIVDCT